MSARPIDPELRKNHARFLEHTSSEYDRLRQLHTDSHFSSVKIDEAEIESISRKFEETIYREKSRVDANLLHLTSIFTKAVHETRNKSFQHLDRQQQIFRDNINFLRERIASQRHETVAIPEFDRNEFQTRLDKTSDNQKSELIQTKLNEINVAQIRCETRQRTTRHYQSLIEKLRESSHTVQRKNDEAFQDLYINFEAALNNIVNQYNPRSLRPFALKRGPGDELEVRLQDYFKAGVTPSLHYFQPGTTTLQILTVPEANQIDQTLKTKRVELDTNVLIPDYHGTVTTPEGRIFIFGGIDSANNISRKVLEYDPKTNTLHRRSDMLNERYGFAVTYAKGRIYVFGGYGRQGAVIGNNEFYDIKTNTWSALPNSSVATAQSSVVNFRNIYFYKFGGYLQDKSLYGAIERFSLIDNSWTTVVAHTESKVPIYPLCATAQINANEVLIFGGVDEKGRGTRKCFLFTIDQWRSGNTVNFNERITPLEDADLPTADGFWDQQTIAQGDRIYALQNVSDIRGEVVGRRVLEYKNRTWNVLTK